jgi:hypothetical protein
MMVSIRPTGIKHTGLRDVAEGTHPYHSSSTRLEEALSMAEVWRLNDERNKSLASKAVDKKLK